MYVCGYGFVKENRMTDEQEQPQDADPESETAADEVEVKVDVTIDEPAQDDEKEV